MKAYGNIMMEMAKLLDAEVDCKKVWDLMDSERGSEDFDLTLRPIMKTDCSIGTVAAILDKDYRNVPGFQEDEYVNTNDAFKAVWQTETADELVTLKLYKHGSKNNVWSFELTVAHNIDSEDFGADVCETVHYLGNLATGIYRCKSESLDW